MSCCPICYDDHKKTFPTLSCGHSGCQECLKQWFETEETTGQLAPTCPVETCRKPVPAQEASLVLGRSFIPAGSNPKKRQRDDSTTLDESTKKWLKENTIDCGGCQTPLQKSEGCDKLQCLCGYRVCWKCRAVGANCRCNPGHGFVDNVTGLPSWGNAEQASAQDLGDFKTFLQEQKKKDPFRAFHERLLRASSHRSDSLGMLSFGRNGTHARKKAAKTRRLDSLGTNNPYWGSTTMHFGAPTQSFRLDRSSSLHNSYSKYSNGLNPMPLSNLPIHNSNSNNNTLPFQSLLRAANQDQDDDDDHDDDYSKAMRLSLQAMSEFDRDMAQAIRMSINEETATSGNTASNPVFITDDDEEEDRKPAAIVTPISNIKKPVLNGKSASDPVWLDDSDED